MNKIFRSFITTLVAATMLTASFPASANTQPLNASELNENTQNGVDLFRGIFFDVGEYGGKLDEAHIQNAQLFIERDAEISRDPDRYRDLADYLAAEGKMQAAENTLIVADVLEGTAGSSPPSASEVRELLISAMHHENPKFFAAFAKAMTSGDVNQVHKKLVGAGHLVAKGLETLEAEGHDLKDIQLGPQEGPVAVVIVLVLVVFINLAVTIDIKDTPDDKAPPCQGDDCDCSGGGDCGFVMPLDFLTNKAMAGLIAERFAGAL